MSGGASEGVLKRGVDTVLKKLFRGYVDFDESEIDEIWRNGIFVFDTNILLNLYRYSKDTRDIFIKVLEAIKDQLWIPHQVAKEYFKNRFTVITDQNKLYSTILKDIGFEKIKSDIGKYKDRHSSIDVRKIVDIINDMEKKVNEILDQSKSRDINYLKSDEICEKITKLFDEKVGDPYSEDQLIGLYKLAEERFKKKVPPGFKDEKKGIPDKYNDFILWRQIVDFAEHHQRNIILITDDKKDDWWLSIDGKTIGPRPELIQEMYDTAQTNCLIYQATSFLSVATEKLYTGDNGNVEKAINEVENLNESDLKLNNISDFCTNGLREYGYSIYDILNYIRNLQADGIYEFTTEDIVRHFNKGTYIIGHPLNRIIGTTLSELGNDDESIVILTNIRTSILDDNGHSTTVASWGSLPIDINNFIF